MNGAAPPGTHVSASSLNAPVGAAGDLPPARDPRSRVWRPAPFAEAAVGGAVRELEGEQIPGDSASKRASSSAPVGLAHPRERRAASRSARAGSTCRRAHPSSAPPRPVRWRPPGSPTHRSQSGGVKESDATHVVARGEGDDAARRGRRSQAAALAASAVVAFERRAAAPDRARRARRAVAPQPALQQSPERRSCRFWAARSTSRLLFDHRDAGQRGRAARRVSQEGLGVQGLAVGRAARRPSARRGRGRPRSACRTTRPLPDAEQVGDHALRARRRTSVRCDRSPCRSRRRSAASPRRGTASRRLREEALPGGMRVRRRVPGWARPARPPRRRCTQAASRATAHGVDIAVAREARWCRPAALRTGSRKRATPGGVERTVARARGRRLRRRPRRRCPSPADRGLERGFDSVRCRTK